jgi:dolichol kinase
MIDPDTKSEWNSKRKLWHATGCLVMAYAFYEWKDVSEPVHGPTVLLGLAATLTTMLVTIDFVRLAFPRVNENVRLLPFFGTIIRDVERDHFNASTYCFLAATLLVTAYRLGWNNPYAIVSALTVLALADPAAAYARRLIRHAGPRASRLFGCLVFVAIAFLILHTTKAFMHASPSVAHLLTVAIAAALVEAYTYNAVRLLHPLTRRACAHLAPHPFLAWITRLYPDDNLTIPLLVGLLLM